MTRTKTRLFPTPCSTQTAISTYPFAPRRGYEDIRDNTYLKVNPASVITLFFLLNGSTKAFNGMTLPNSLQNLTNSTIFYWGSSQPLGYIYISYILEPTHPTQSTHYNMVYSTTPIVCSSCPVRRERSANKLMVLTLEECVYIYIYKRKGRKHHWEGANRSVRGSFQAYPQLVFWRIDFYLYILSDLNNHGWRPQQ